MPSIPNNTPHLFVVILKSRYQYDDTPHSYFGYTYSAPAQSLAAALQVVASAVTDTQTTCQELHRPLRIHQSTTQVNNITYLRCTFHIRLPVSTSTSS